MARTCSSYLWIILPCVTVQCLMLWLLIKDLSNPRTVSRPTTVSVDWMKDTVELEEEEEVTDPLDVLPPHVRLLPDQSPETTLEIQADVSKASIDRCTANDSSTLCPCVPPVMKPRMAIDVRRAASYHWNDVTRILRPLSVGVGGAHRPTECVARQRILIIVPYRDREQHLKGLLVHLHPILHAQQLDYRILVVEQRDPAIFNKAACMNSAFVEASVRWKFDCVIFHDVDTLMEDGRSLFRCGRNPVHYSICLDREKYRRSMQAWFGGVVAMTTKQFRDVNGFSNRFFGWGAEDINMYFRMIQVVTKEGLSNVRYSLVDYQESQFYTYMKLDLNMTRLKYPSLGRQMHLYKKANGDCPTKPTLQELTTIDKRSCVSACDARSECRAAIFINITLSNSFEKKCVLKSGYCPQEVRKRKHWIFSKQDYIPCRLYKLNHALVPVNEETTSAYDEEISDDRDEDA
ncbi:hypothetical protein CAPTEDRAFT_219917 [Capitella teleta]|uniref:Beta-1,4-galactosyltransferase n=1 Tax=Capitella teleta TaxID=283909 RepID=R7V7V2_CAPTE|nr:hypothetical protein CAPTEDRAFT_219917 [Capitella teleta]|eukprot:ELU11825.1 hypothetical protein CAPTEDRAFT_219917 [Capitella teleta]